MTGSASIETVERGKHEPFDPVRISASRVNSYLTCGVAFKRKYIDGEVPTQLGSAALFGNIMHEAAEKWALNREQDFVRLVAQAWLSHCKGTPVVKFIEQYQSLSVQAMKLEKQIRDDWAAQGKESKAPRMTAVWKKSQVAQDIEKLIASWLPKMNEESPWTFTERDPLPSLYDESLIVAKKYGRKYASLPPALHTEFGFTVEWRGFILRGFIDAIEPVGDGYGITDYKTYRADPPPSKDWRQSVMYDIAFRTLCEQGVLPFDPEAPRWCIFDYMRLLKRRDYIVGQADEDKLYADLAMYNNAVTHGVFLPAHKNTNPDFCDFDDCCMKTRGDGVGCRGNLYPEDEDGEATA